LGSFDFVSSVGGVAFGDVARPGPGFGGAVGVRYDPSAFDGQRLQVVIGERTLGADLPDWLLIPIARFAGSSYDSCVSLFGPRTTDRQYDIVYHDDFQNTLLGLRLLQADIMLFDLNETWHLPRLGGLTVLGAGETEPRQFNERSAMRIESALSNGQFQSWVMTDRDEDVVFSDDLGQLRLSGLPYYYFWTSDMKAYEARRAELIGQANAARQAQRVAEHNRIVEQVNRMRPEVHEVTSLTAALKADREALRAFNQPVYDAATNTMRYAAFFRYVKKQNPAGWNAFLAQLNSVTPQPSITTPTAWAR
jgi:hypothetical protein